MLKPETQFSIRRLSDALQSSFDWIIRRDRKEALDDIGTTWAELIADTLKDVRLVAPPVVDYSEPFLPFIELHRIRTFLFDVAGGGMRGGPRLDVLFQVWFDTEDSAGGFGIPLLMRKIPASGRMPLDTWDELQEASRKLNVATPAGRIMLFGDGADFDWGETRLTRYHPVIVMSTQSFASLRAPPHPVFGRSMEHFSYDLASGWIGDPAISSRTRSPVFDELLSNLHIGQILRISVERERS